MIVVGAGIVGAAITHRATMAGLSVMVLAASPPGEGVTAAGMGHLVAMDGGAAELALCRYSLSLWRSQFAERRESEYQQCGTLWVAETSAEMEALREKSHTLAAEGIACDLITGSDLIKIEPLLRDGLAGGLRVGGDAVVYAPRVAWVMLQDAMNAGCVGRYDARVTSVHAHGVTLANGERFSAGAVVVAAGMESAALLPDLQIIPRKGHLVITDRYPDYADHPRKLNHQVLEVGYAASAHSAGESVAFNVCPRVTGQILIGSSRQPGIATARADMPVVRRMLERGVKFMPSLAKLRALRVWTGLRPGTPDGLPYIGRGNQTSGVWVAGGHEGLGITTAPGTAAIVVDQILGRSPAIDATPFVPDRVTASRLAA